MTDEYVSHTMSPAKSVTRTLATSGTCRSRTARSTRVRRITDRARTTGPVQRWPPRPSSRTATMTVTARRTNSMSRAWATPVDAAVPTMYRISDSRRRRKRPGASAPRPGVDMRQRFGAPTHPGYETYVAPLSSPIPGYNRGLLGRYAVMKSPLIRRLRRPVHYCLVGAALLVAFTACDRGDAKA